MDTIDELLKQGYTMDCYRDDNGTVHVFLHHKHRVKSFSVSGKTFKECLQNLNIKILGF